MKTVKNNVRGLLGILLVICMALSLIATIPDTAAAAADSVRLVETGDLYDTLSAGIAAAISAGHIDITLEVIGDVAETSDIIITDKTDKVGVFIERNVTIVGAGGPHTITMAASKFAVEAGSLTLGDGTDDNTLTILRSIVVTRGTVNVRDGAVIKSSGVTALLLSGPDVNGVISGGRIEAARTGLEMEKGAKLAEISGGEFYGGNEALHLSDAGTKIDLISGGSFYQTDPETTLHGHAVFVQNEAQIGLISGGYFEAVSNNAMIILRGGWVDEISGGLFFAKRIGAYSPIPSEDTRNSSLRVENGFAGEGYLVTGIGTISGGIFTGGDGKGTNFGILLITDYGQSRIDYITGGTAYGSVALQNDRGGYINEISGGQLIGNQGLLNVGVIEKISNKTKITGTSSYGIYNYYGGRIDEISGGRIVSDKDNGIMNAGLIKLVSGGTIIGYRSAINSDGLNKGRLDTISGGVFWGKNNTAIMLAYALDLEPGLDADKGVGRYWGFNGVIFNNPTLVTYPVSTVTSPGEEYFMSSDTRPVTGIAGTEFKYLRLASSPAPTYTVTYEPGEHGEFTALSYVDLDFGSATPEAPEPLAEDGWAFTGWAPTISDVVTDSAIYTAQWTRRLYDYYVTVNGSRAEITGEGVYTEESLVTIDSGARSNYIFTGWTVTEGDVVLENPRSAKTTFIMPANDVTVTAHWRYANGSGGEDEPPEPVSVAFAARKVVSGAGARLTAGQFSFAAYDDSGVAAVAKNDAAGDVIFTAIEYSEAGTYTYRIVETSAGDNNWIMDRTEHIVTVTVANSGGTLSANVKYSGGAIPIFRNQYKDKTATFRISKSLVDTVGTPAENGYEFIIVLYERAVGGRWEEIGEYTVYANGAPITIPGLHGAKTYQLVEKTNDWYNTLGFEAAVNSAVIGAANGASAAFSIPALTENMTIDILIRNEKIGEPGGTPQGGGPDPNPPLIEFLDEEPPLTLFISEHVAYVIGYQDGTVRPEKDITRAEVATVFFRLLTDEARISNWTQENQYNDVSLNDWYNNAVSVMNNMGIVIGYPDETFKPNAQITRAELAAIAARFARSMGMLPLNSLNFVDIADHWAKEDIDYAAAVGWVAGYPDGTYKPDQPITRAEFMTLVNRMLGRIPEDPDDLLPDESIIWPDNSDTNAWYYLAVQEATNSHLPEYKDAVVPGLQFEYEFWVEMIENRDWSLLEKR